MHYLVNPNHEDWANACAFFLGRNYLDARHVRAFFGIDFEAMSVLWSMIEQECRARRYTETYLLWTLHFLRVYPTCDRLDVFLPVSYPTYAAAIWDIIDLINTKCDVVCA
jgi:hypothetical protein